MSPRIPSTCVMMINWMHLKQVPSNSPPLYLSQHASVRLSVILTAAKLRGAGRSLCHHAAQLPGENISSLVIAQVC